MTKKNKLSPFRIKDKTELEAVRQIAVTRNNFVMLIFAPVFMVLETAVLVFDNFVPDPIYAEVNRLYSIIFGSIILITAVPFILNLLMRKRLVWHFNCLHVVTNTYVILLFAWSFIITILDSRVNGYADMALFFTCVMMATALFYVSPYIICPVIIFSSVMLVVVLRFYASVDSHSLYMPNLYLFTIIGAFLNILRYVMLIKELRNSKQVSEMTERINRQKSLQLAERLMEHADLAEQANESKSRFLATMSHEIRTPMNAIIGMSELALRQNLNETSRDYLLQIQSAGKSLLTIINDILDISKIESGKMEIVEAEYNLLVLLRDSTNLIKVRIGDKPVELFVTLNPKLPTTLLGDDVRIKQIILNLAGNAAKFTEKGYINVIIDFAPHTAQTSGTSATAGKPSDAGKSYATTNETSNAGKSYATTNETSNADKSSATVGDTVIDLTIRVQDTGIGIKKDDLGKLFESFQQVNMQTTRKVEGTGLGLSISKQLVGLMGGKLSVESEFGKGSTFFFTIPQKVVSVETIETSGIFVNSGISESDVIFQSRENETKNEVENHLVRLDASAFSVIHGGDLKNGQSASDVENFTAPTARVLVVDDNEVNLQVADGLLKLFSIKADLVSSGQDAINAVGKNDYDMVFMDHMMPDMDGIEAVRRIRALNGEHYQKLCIIALTANVIGGAKEMFLSNGFNGFVGKPIELPDLSDKLRNNLPPEKIIECLENAVSTETSITTETSVPPETSSLIISGLNTEAGIRNTGSRDTYLSVLKTYWRTADKNASDIEHFFESGDLKNYTILVHALKSSSRIIGDLELSDLAAHLELCGNNAQKLENAVERGSNAQNIDSAVTSSSNAKEVDNAVGLVNSAQNADNTVEPENGEQNAGIPVSGVISVSDATREIAEKTPVLLSKYRILKTTLDTFFGSAVAKTDKAFSRDSSEQIANNAVKSDEQNSNMSEISDGRAVFNNLLQSLSVFIDENNLDEAEKLVVSMKDFLETCDNIPRGADELLTTITDALEMIDFETCSTAIQEWKKSQ